MTQVRITDERCEALRLALLSGWAEQMFLIISDTAAIEPDSLPQWLRQCVEAARTMWDALRTCSPSSRLTQTYGRACSAMNTTHGDRAAGTAYPCSARGRAPRRAPMLKEFNQSSPKRSRAPTRSRLARHTFPRPA